jgi:hypothetical protein
MVVVGVVAVLEVGRGGGVVLMIAVVIDSTDILVA